MLIGDPKQAIYAFRGADVVSYLDATRTADTTRRSPVNWRSDAALLAALDTVFNGAALGDERIVVHRVEAATGGATAGRGARGCAGAGPGRLPGGLPSPPRRDLAIVGPARELVARDLAADVAGLLSSAAHDRRRAGAAR